ncbi:glycosyltransferase [Candidatus Tisiphia endosymbiont of Sialis lutaria]|uniref:glycosyltransferase n=1 Tax=Candidatus Tisiphia endosymbiont of Sialis lutaria TaxID=2029164 RepID=UPI00312C9B00
MSYFLQPKRVKYRITLVIVGSLLEVTTSPTSPELTISTDSCGAREILSHENDSVIVPINDAEKLAESIIFLINNPEIVKKYIEGAYKKVQNLYTPAIVGKKLYKILTDIRLPA